MKPTDNQSESTEKPWPRVLSIAGEEFQQSFAVARLAVELWKASKTSNVKLIEKASPKDFLADAWELIQKARTHVKRPATAVEYMAQGDGSHEELAVALGQLSEPNVAFAELCDPDRKGGGTETTIEVLDAGSGKRIEVKWKVYRSLLGFEKLFWRWWCDVGEKWKRGDPEIGTVQVLDLKGKPRREDHYKPAERKRLAARASNTAGWKRRGERLLRSWKEHGVPRAAFLALARFRRAHDKRAVNLTKPNRSSVVKSRKRQLKQ